MNFLDRTIAFFDPQAGLKRAAARVTLDQVRAYDGAKGGRRSGDWAATNAAANVEIKGALPRLRARSRDIIRNTWWGARGQTIITSHAVGTGIEVKSKTGDKAVDTLVNSLWSEWCERCDLEEQMSFAGQLALATSCIFESGEVLARMVPLRSQKSKRHVPLELQLLEPDHLDASHDYIQTSDEKIVDQGIAYDKRGKRTGYWLFPHHPGARGLLLPTMSVFVPADQILHPYRKLRIGQGRGVPWVAPVLMKGRDVADLEDAIVVQSRIQACLSLWVKTNDASRTLAQASTETGKDGDKRRIEKLAPGAIIYGEPGEEATAIQPTGSTQFEPVLMMNWLALAAGIGITYDQMTGDLRRANFSSLRAGKIEFRRMVEQFQWLTLADMLIKPLRRKWIETAVDFGVLPPRADNYPFELIMPAVEPIDPLKDMEADILAVRSGRLTWRQFVAMWGFDPDTQLDEIVAQFKVFDEAGKSLAGGFALDTDPRLALASTKGGAKEEATTEVNTNVKKSDN